MTRRRSSPGVASGLALPRNDLALLIAREHGDPHRVLGVHPAGKNSVVVRAFHPDAVRVDCLLPDGTTAALEPVASGGLFGTLPRGRRLPLHYCLRFTFTDGGTWEHQDPYRFLPTIGETDLYLYNEGTHRRLW